MKKYFLIGGLIFLVSVVGMFLFVRRKDQELFFEQRDSREEYIPEVKYQLFSPSLQIEEIFETVYILNDDQLPKTVELEGYEITIQEVDIERFPLTGRKNFSAYLKIMFNGKEEKIGFWHPTAEVHDKRNGCLDQKGRDVCSGSGGILEVETEEWYKEPTKENVEKGIIGAQYKKLLFLQEIDYDFVSDKWNYVKIALGLYKENTYPMITH